MKSLKEFFEYVPRKDNPFTLPDDRKHPSNEQGKLENFEEIKNITYSLKRNIEYVKMKYNTLINSDIILREFTINARGKQYNAFLLYIDGMVDSQLMNDFVLTPLMLRNNSNLYNGNQNKVMQNIKTNKSTVRKFKRFNLDEYILNCLLPQNSVIRVKSFEKAFLGVNSGNCALFIDTLPLCFDIDIKGFKQRSVSTPNNEIIIKGPQEAFVENIRTNTSLLRRIINNENLIIESVNIGRATKTNCAVCYIQNIANTDLISEVKYRLNNLDINSLLASGELDQLISDSNELRNT